MVVMDAPFVALSEITVPIEGAEALEAAFQERLGAVDHWAGFLGLSVLRDRRRPGRYVMVSQWESKDCFSRYMRSADHQRSHDRIPSGRDRPRPAGYSEYDLVAR